MNDHERGFLTFLAEPTKRRLETLLDLGEKRRRDVRELLHHSVRLDPRFAQRGNHSGILQPGLGPPSRQGASFRGRRSRAEGVRRLIGFGTLRRGVNHHALREQQPPGG